MQAKEVENLRVELKCNGELKLPVFGEETEAIEAVAEGKREVVERGSKGEKGDE